MTKDELLAALAGYPGDTAIGWYNDDPSSQRPEFLTDIEVDGLTTVIPIRILSITNPICAIQLADVDHYIPSTFTEPAGDPFPVLLLRRK